MLWEDVRGRRREALMVRRWLDEGCCLYVKFAPGNSMESGLLYIIVGFRSSLLFMYEAFRSRTSRKTVSEIQLDGRLSQLTRDEPPHETHLEHFVELCERSGVVGVVLRESGRLKTQKCTTLSVVDCA
jgi:hypothetical protein